MILKPRPFRKLRQGRHWSKTGLVGLWLMNEGTGDKVLDLSGNDFNLTAFENHSWFAGKYGYEIDFFDTNPNYTYLSTSQNVGGTLLSPVNITIVAHVKYTHNSDSIICSTWRDGDINSQSYMLWLDNPLWEFIVRDSGGTAAAANGSAGVQNEYIHIAGTYDGSNAKLYENGVLTDTDGTASGNLRSAGAYPFFVATKEGVEGASTDHFQGQMSYIYMYNRALTAEEILRLYINPFIMFDRDEIWSPATQGGGAPPAGNAGIMTTNTGFWGATF